MTMYITSIMHTIFSIKKIIGITGLLALGVLSFFFRDNVSRWLAFNDSIPPAVVVNDTAPGNTPPVISSAGDKITPPIVPPSIVSPLALSGYKGRDPAEVRPTPDEIKLFSEEQKQDLYRAIGNYGTAVKENPDYFNGWLQIGLLKKVIGDFEGARDAWEYAGVIRPQNSISFSNLGELYWRYVPDFPRSEMNFRTAIINNLGDVMVYVSLSHLYLYSYTEKFTLADEVIQEGLAANPDAIDLLKALARVYEVQKDYAHAIEAWERVLASEPGNTDVAATITALKQKNAQ